MRKDTVQRGVSIIEVLVGLALLGGLLVAGSRFIATSSRNTSSLAQNAESARIAQQLSDGVLKEIGKRGITLVATGSSQDVEMWVDVGNFAAYVYDPVTYGNEWRLSENGGLGATLIEPGTRVLIKGAKGVIPARVLSVSTYKDKVTFDISAGCSVLPGKYIVIPQGVVSLASAPSGGVDVFTLWPDSTNRWVPANYSIPLSDSLTITYVYQSQDGTYERTDAVLPYDQLNGRRMVSVELSGLAGNQSKALSIPVAKDLASAFSCPPPSPPNTQISEAVFSVTGSDSFFPTLYGSNGNVTVRASGGYVRTLYGLGIFYLSDVPNGGTASFEARSFTATYNGVRYTWDPSPASGTWEPRPYFFQAQTIVFGLVPAQVTVTASGLPSYASWGGSYSGSGPLASSGAFGGTGSGSTSFQVNPGTYTFSFNEASASRSQDGYSWTEIWTRSPTSAGPVNINSGDSVSYSISYSGPVPGTLCYDSNCSSATPGVYYAPSDQVIRTWTESRNESCPSGYTGSVRVTEYWQTVKYWTPRGGGLSSRGTLTFWSATRDELVGADRSDNCSPGSSQPSPPSKSPPSGCCTCYDCRPPTCCQ